VLKLTGKVGVHAHPDIFLDRIAVRKVEGGETRRFAGLVYKKAYLEFLGANFVLNQDFREVAQGLFLTGEVPRRTPFEKNDPSLFVEIDGKRVQDTLMDDQSLVLDTGKGLFFS
jgi:7,8-dihydropterin-6-yl-methyl-4-(beta-D-ribofuranosyl)aminobenzene 5'-phosphate synthase